MLEQRLQLLKSNPEAFRDLLTGNVNQGSFILSVRNELMNLVLDREERIIDGDKKFVEPDPVELSDNELEMRRVSYTRIIVWLKHHQTELDALQENELLRMLPIIGLVPVTLDPEDIFDELVQQRLVSVRIYIYVVT